MKRIALAVVLVIMAAGACKKAEDRGMSAAGARSDTTMAADTTHHMAPDTSKARP
jgi:hypothetical protein